MSKGVDKNLQDAAQCRALELNHFDYTTRPTSVEPMSQAAEQSNESSEHNLFSARQTSMEEPVSTANILESLKIDTSSNSRQPSQSCTDTDKKHQQSPLSECAEQDEDAQ